MKQEHDENLRTHLLKTLGAAACAEDPEVAIRARKLLVRLAPPNPKPVFAKLLKHTVSKGESLHMIADIYDTPLARILLANPDLKVSDVLRPSIVLNIPYRCSAGPNG